MPDASSPIAKIAVGFAIAALVTAAIAVVVLVTREPAQLAEASRAPSAPAVAIHGVAASEIVRLDRGTVEAVSTGPVGVKVTDAKLREALWLEPGDVITGISGKPTNRQFDVYDAVLGASMMNAKTLFVDVVRDGQPLLLRWEIEGDLRVARNLGK